jgi:hypothetical protein
VSAVKIVPRPVFYPGRTVWGKVGECAYLGAIMEDVHVYLSQQESREVLNAWKWPTPEKYAQLEKQNAELSEALTDAEKELHALRKLSEALAEFKVAV